MAMMVYGAQKKGPTSKKWRSWSCPPAKRHKPNEAGMSDSFSAITESDENYESDNLVSYDEISGDETD